MEIKRKILDKILDRYELAFSKICTCRGGWEDYTNVITKAEFKNKLIDELKQVGIEIKK